MRFDHQYALELMPIHGLIDRSCHHLKGLLLMYLCLNMSSQKKVQVESEED